MNSKSSELGDAEAIRRLLAESGVEETPEISGTLVDLRAEARTPPPAPNAELEALFTAGVTPLRKPSRRRGYLLGGAIIAAMAAGTTGVAAANGGLWITAEDAQAPAPVKFEQVPAPTPAPADTDPATVPPALPAAPEEPALGPAADNPGPAEPVPAGPEGSDGEPAGSGWNGGSGAGRDGHPGSGREENRNGPGRDKGQEGPARPDGNNEQGHGRDNGQGVGRDNNQGRGDAGKDGKGAREDGRGGPPHGNGPGGGRGSD
ncbi:MAG: hypothetical protein ABS910_03810 [Arthrobacter sp.]